MTASEQLKRWVTNASDAEVSLWFALVRLADALDNASDAQRDATLEAVWLLTQHDTDWSVWRSAIEHWE